MDRLTAALTQCRRDDQGLLKLSDLWSEAKSVDLSQVPGFVLELHTKRQTELQLENIAQVSVTRKRTREEAEDERAIAEIDAKRDLAVAELGAKREFARDREQLSTDRERLMLRLAAEGNADVIKALFAPKP